MNKSWKVSGYSLATTFAVAYVLCSIFDAVFPPYGLLAALAPASPWPLTNGLRGFLTGLIVFTVAGFVLGAIHGAASGFWNKRVR
ncbi:MAG: hypothetical protein AB7U95_00045 [Reyranella sp.]